MNQLEFAVAVPVGVIAEYYTDYAVLGVGKPCHHCKYSDTDRKDVLERRTWLVPRAVVVITALPEEYGVVCLDCILERKKQTGV